MAILFIIIIIIIQMDLFGTLCYEILSLKHVRWDWVSVYQLQKLLV